VTNMSSRPTASPQARFSVPVDSVGAIPVDGGLPAEDLSDGTPNEPNEPIKVLVPGNHLMAALLGPRDEHLRQIERAYPNTRIIARGNEVSVSGADATLVASMVEELAVLVATGQPLDSSTVARSIDMVAAHERPSQVLTTAVFKAGKGGRSVRPKTSGQKRYADAIASNIITVGIGPAGSGKSYLAVALAVQALQSKQVNRIILTRPAVEAGERLGFLPGDLMAKVDPYLRPLYDALFDMLEPEGVAKLMEKGAIEVAPLAFMRGRTLNNSFIILDEAQNTTPEQMKMFLTRIGFGSKAVITGDVTQVDLKADKSGLVGLEAILGQIEGLEFVRLGRSDVVRHRIVADIVDAYERADEALSAASASSPTAASRPRQKERQ
jgi:phosphate starvation-inducible protein PhoH and related proteins